MHRIVSSALVLVMVCIANTDVRADASGPKEVLRSYLSASFEGRYVEAYQLISSIDKKERSLDDYLQNRSGNYGLFMKIIGKMVTYDIVDMTGSGSYAKARVRVHTPDFVAMLSDMIAFSLTSVLLGKDVESEIGDWLIARAQGKNVPMRVNNNTINMIKEPEGWKIYLGWKKKKEETPGNLMLKNLLKGAKKLKESQD